MSGEKRKRLIIGGVFLAAVFWTAAGIWLVRSLFDGGLASAQIGRTQNLASAKEVDGGKSVSEGVSAETMKIKLLDVDLTKLREENADTVGWVQVMGTNINYPFVQAGDNDYYKTHSFDKSYNPAGWVFLDATNLGDLSDAHNILYLSGKLEETEFEPARSVIASRNWLETPKSFVIRTSTEKSNAVWQVFSIYKTAEELKLSGGVLELAEEFKGRSVYDFNVPFLETDKILTFAVRYSDEEFVAIHGKLILVERKAD